MPATRPKDARAELASLSRALTPPDWRRVERIALIRREIRESLSPNAIELLLNDAELVVEAGLDPAGSAAYATVMVTVDVARMREQMSEPSDAETVRRLVALIGKDPRVGRRLAQLARPYLCDVAQRAVAVEQIELDHAARQDDLRILIDADAMVSLGASKAPPATPGRRGGR